MPIMNEFKILYKYFVITQYFTHRPKCYKACKAPLKKIFSSCFYKILHTHKKSLSQYCSLINITTPSTLLVKCLWLFSASFPFCFLNPVLDTCIRLLEQRQQFPDFTHYASDSCGQYLLGFWLEKQWKRSCRFTWNLKKQRSQEMLDTVQVR